MIASICRVLEDSAAKEKLRGIITMEMRVTLVVQATFYVCFFRPRLCLDQGFEKFAMTKEAREISQAPKKYCNRIA